MQDNKKLILKVIVGSRAHGLSNANSDTDYRGVFILPTSEILSLGNSKQQTIWNEGNDDETYWELSHFLNLACHCNPTILETFVAPTVFATKEGMELRNLFPYIWHPTRVRDAFIGYSVNQRKKFLEEKDARSAKYAVAYLRTLIQATELLRSGILRVNMSFSKEYECLKRWKSWTHDDVNYGEVIGVCKEWEQLVNDAYDIHMKQGIGDEIGYTGEPQQPNLDKVNAFLLSVRQANW